MSDKLETKNKQNIKEVDFKNKREINIPSEFIDKNEVNYSMSANFGKVSPHWFNFLSMWHFNAYKTFYDMDKYLIMIHLIQKTFEHYTDIFIIISEEEFYKQTEFKIERINLTEIVAELQMPKETVRRKINEMIEENILSRKDKKILLTLEAFQWQKPKNSIKSLSKFLSKASSFLATEEWFGKSATSEEIEEFTRKNFTLIWRFFFRFMIPFLKRTRKFYGDLETSTVAGAVFSNHVQRLQALHAEQPLSFKVNNFKAIDAVEMNYLNWTKYLTTSKENIIGINASSISDISGIPRATVIRKLKILKELDLISIDKKQLYKTGKLKKKVSRELELMFIKNQIELNKFISTFFELYKKPRF